MARTKGSKNNKPRTKKSIPETIEIENVEYTLDKIMIRDEGLIKKSNRYLRDIMRDIEEDIIDMNPLIQRAYYQWTIKQCTKLIMSILKGRPIGIITTAVLDGGKEILVDGLQRLTTIKDFMEDKFKLSKEGCVISCSWVNQNGTIVNQDIDLGGKYYSQMPAVFKKAFADSFIDHHQYWYFDDEEIEDIMYCMNNGTPFKPWQKLRTSLGEKMLETLDDTLNSPVWEEIRGVNYKNDTILACVIRSMMLLDGYGYGGLSASSADKFVNEFNSSNSKNGMQTIKQCMDSFEDLNTVVTILGQKSESDLEFFNATNTPHIIYNLNQFRLSGKPIEVYADFIHAFINDEIDDVENNIKEYNSIIKKTKGSGGSRRGNNAIHDRQTILEMAMYSFCFIEEKDIESNDTPDNINTYSDGIEGLDVYQSDNDEEYRDPNVPNNDNGDDKPRSFVEPIAIRKQKENVYEYRAV